VAALGVDLGTTTPTTKTSPPQEFVCVNNQAKVQNTGYRVIKYQTLVIKIHFYLFEMFITEISK